MAEARLSDHEFKLKAMEALTGAPAPGSRWRHHKGGLYEVLLTTVKEDTLEPLIHYRSLTYGLRLTRTLANWCEWVRGEDSPTGETRIVPRFVQVEEDRTAE